MLTSAHLNKHTHMTSILITLLTTAIIGLITWIYNQSITITKIQAKVEAMEPMKGILQELQLTIRELNITIIYIKDELKELKDKK